jgi:hypothetical protein
MNKLYTFYLAVQIELLLKDTTCRLCVFELVSTSLVIFREKKLQIYNLISISISFLNKIYKINNQIAYYLLRNNRLNRVLFRFWQGSLIANITIFVNLFHVFSSNIIVYLLNAVVGFFYSWIYISLVSYRRTTNLFTWLKIVYILRIKSKIFELQVVYLELYEVPFLLILFFW